MLKQGDIIAKVLIFSGQLKALSTVRVGRFIHSVRNSNIQPYLPYTVPLENKKFLFCLISLFFFKLQNKKKKSRSRKNKEILGSLDFQTKKTAPKNT